MAKTKARRRERGSFGRWVFVISLGAIGVLFLLSFVGSAGPVGERVREASFSFLGVGSLLLPLLTLGGAVFILSKRESFPYIKTLGGAAVALALYALIGLVAPETGGRVGSYLGGAVAGSFGFLGALVLLAALAAIGLIAFANLGEAFAYLGRLTRSFVEKLQGLFSKKLSEDDYLYDSESFAEQENRERDPSLEDAVESTREPAVHVFGQDQKRAAAGGIASFDAAYEAPPLSLLGEDRGKPGVGDIKANANIIKRTFQNFGISVEMDEVSVGPTVTRYAIKPAEGVRLSKIVSLQNNLELALAAHPVRIEAPIPGKSLVGIEVPNASKATVGLGSILSFPEWRESTRPLLAAIGRDIAGMPHFVNIAKMPHGLVAGATGSGKSVAIHTLITSLLYRAGPNQLRFIMVDPKRVELTLYNGIPHLLTPVITDPKKCIFALKWAAKEMERRYNVLEAEGARDIEAYHRATDSLRGGGEDADTPETMPYIIIVIDELADIMQSYPRELEACVVRLAQMSRAVGIHLLLSTQRPSVNVITGLIKANVPTRFALQVASQVDSRTILDGSGAESLLGAGDMLYLSTDMAKPVRLQTAFVSDGEVKKVVDFIKKKNEPVLSTIDLSPNGASERNDAIALAGGFDEEEVDDEVYEAAKTAVEEVGRASTSYLQRKLRIGYSRAARIMDLLEERGVIGPADGSRPREILTGRPPQAEDASKERPS